VEGNAEDIHVLEEAMEASSEKQWGNLGSAL